MQDATTACHVADGKGKGNPEFPSGYYGMECREEPKEFNKMSIACDRCNQWFHWKCVDLTGEEAFLEDLNLIWMCDSCSTS